MNMNGLYDPVDGLASSWEDFSMHCREIVAAPHDLFCFFPSTSKVKVI